MKIAVCGLWHLGTVTATCLAEMGHEVVGYDVGDTSWQGRDCEPPVYEPGLKELMERNISEGRLTWDSDPACISNADVVWITWETPLFEDGQPNPEWVLYMVRTLFAYLPKDCTVIVSSQLPVGSTTALAKECGRRDLDWIYIPENLRLGKAIECFMKPDRVVIGLNYEQKSANVLGHSIWQDSEFPIIAMSRESAEMSKHAINAFLATQIALTNEIAVFCEKTGADARGVEQALRTEPRIGPKAYVKAGAAFAGGTLARDLHYLANNSYVALTVLRSNDIHGDWISRKIPFDAKTIAVWGLTYKPYTDTLRQSRMQQYVEYLLSLNRDVRVHDPNIATDEKMNPYVAMEGADVLIIGNEHPSYKDISVNDIVRLMRRPHVIDPSGFLAITDPRIRYEQVGVSSGQA